MKGERGILSRSCTIIYEVTVIRHQKGFWRYYKKSGKSVWIAEQIKGSGKNIEPKTYKM